MRVSCEPQTCAVLVSCLRFLFFFLCFFVFGLTRCFRARTVCAIVMVCSHTWLYVCVCVCHAYVCEHVSDHSVRGYVFLYIYCFEFVLTVCPAMCSPRARGMLVVCSPCARDRLVLVMCSSCARRVLVLDVCSP